MNAFNQTVKVFSSKRKGIFLISFIAAFSFSLILFEYAHFSVAQSSSKTNLDDDGLLLMETDQIKNILYELPKQAKKPNKASKIIPVEVVPTQRTSFSLLKKINSEPYSLFVKSVKSSKGTQLKISKKEKVLGFSEINLSNYPFFQNCESLEDPIERYKCTQHSISSYLVRNTLYPTIPREIGIEGTVMVSFIINKKGKIQDPKILRSVDKQIDAEAIRVIKNMPDFAPGNINGVPISVRFEVPIHFKLAKN